MPSLRFGPLRPRTLALAAGLACLVGAATVLDLWPTTAGARGEVEMVLEGDPLVRLLPRDAIAAIDEPEMIPAAEAEGLLSDAEPVLGVVDGRSARAYPTWVLDGHEIVNDRLGERPIAATW